MPKQRLNGGEGPRMNQNLLKLMSQVLNICAGARLNIKERTEGDVSRTFYRKWTPQSNIGRRSCNTAQKEGVATKLVLGGCMIGFIELLDKNQYFSTDNTHYERYK